MRRRLRSAVMTFAIAMVAAFAGAAIAQILVSRAQTSEPSLLEAIRPSLNLDSAQDARLDRMQSLHEAESRRLEAKIREQNLTISDAIDKDHRASPAVLEAIDEAQMTINEMQRRDVINLLQARSILDQFQKRRFDERLKRALTDKQ